MFNINGEDKIELRKTKGLTEQDDVWVELKAGIKSSDPDTNEEIDQTKYWGDESWGSSSVTGAQLILSIKGDRIVGDNAQDLVYDNQLDLTKRDSACRITYKNGIKIQGECTICNIKGPGGDAGTKQAIEFEIHFNGKPTVTPAAG